MIIFCLKFLLSPLACVRETHDEPARRRCCFSPTAEKKMLSSYRLTLWSQPQPACCVSWEEPKKASNDERKPIFLRNEMERDAMMTLVCEREANQRRWIRLISPYISLPLSDGWVSCVLSTLEYIYWIWSSLACSRVELSFTWISQDIVKIHIRWTREASYSTYHHHHCVVLKDYRLSSHQKYSRCSHVILMEKIDVVCGRYMHSTQSALSDLIGGRHGQPGRRWMGKMENEKCL